MGPSACAAAAHAWVVVIVSGITGGHPNKAFAPHGAAKRAGLGAPPLCTGLGAPPQIVSQDGRVAWQHCPREAPDVDTQDWQELLVIRHPN